MPNRLVGETSPYLLQHQNNPVDWHPWGEEALRRAQAEDKPIFLSIGYSACHWCHVMEHESFEDAGIAAFLNEHFVSIKVDREERPDLDQIYMNAVQVTTGRGGWPMSVFLTPDLEPFFAGTYWPPQAKMGMPGFDQVIHGVAEAWQQRRPQAIESAGRITQAIRQIGAERSDAGPELSLELLHGAAAGLERVFDWTWGGFGGPPKFPHPMDLQLLLRVHSRDRHEQVKKMVTLTLDRMAHGGMYDQLGGGFHRYSVDDRWLVPHFEKMLYDNALLAGSYLDGYLVTGNEEYSRITRETLDFVLREMHDPAGGFYSTQDADSEGVEGKFFVWDREEIVELLGAERAQTFCRVYDVTDEGNFEGHNILNLPKTIEQSAQIMGRDEAELQPELAEGRRVLFEQREKRIRPGLDDKVLVSWNGLMIDSMARASGVLGEAKYRAAAEAAADFIWRELRNEKTGRLLHTWRDGEARLDAYLDDYAALANGLVSLYEATFDEKYLERAVELAEIIIKFFHDDAAGGFFFTASDHEKLIARQKDLVDNATPSGGALAATVLLRVGKVTGKSNYLSRSEETLFAPASHMHDMPTGMGQMLLALDLFLGPTHEFAIVGDAKDSETAAVLDDLRRRYLPRAVVACRAEPSAGSELLQDLFAGKLASDQPAVYICENFVCREPAVGCEAIKSTWETLSPT